MERIFCANWPRRSTMTLIRLLEKVALIFALGPFFYYVKTLVWISGISSIFLLLRWLGRKVKHRFHVDGYVAPGFEKVAEVYRRNIQSKQDLGSAFSVYYRGAPVVDLWGGYADRSALRHREHDTLGMFYSTTKAVTAIVMAMLVDRGLLDYEAKITDYWPEFGQEGKEDIQVKTLLSHQAGLIAIRERHRLSLVRDDPTKLGEILAKQKPFFKPGSDIAYHTLTFGLYADQLVRRVDKQGRNLAQFFQDEIAEKFDIEFYIGLPRHLFHRSCRETGAQFGWKHMLHTLIPTGIHFLALMVYSYVKYGTFYLNNLIGNPTDWKLHRLNDPKFREVPSGASHGFGTARAVAKLMGILANGGTVDRKTLLSKERIEYLNTPLGSGRDRVVLTHITYGPGTVLRRVQNPAGKGRYTFGHWGAGGQMGYADPEYKLGWAYNTNFSNLVHGFRMDHRYTALQQAMYDCVYALENNNKQS